MKRPICARFFVPSEVNFGTISEMNQIRVPDTLRRLYYKFLPQSNVFGLAKKQIFKELPHARSHARGSMTMM